MDIRDPRSTLKLAGIDYFIDWEENVVYVDNLQKLSEHCGMNWSVLAEEVEWRGWKWRNLE